MNRRVSSRKKYDCALRLALSAWAALMLAAPAAAITPAGTPPTFYCDSDRPPGADRVETQLNTVSGNTAIPNGPDRGNQPRWEWTPTGFAPYWGADPLPGGMSWTFINGHEMDRYWTGLSLNWANWYVGSYPPAAAPQLPANRTYYLRYRFNLAPTVDPATYKLRFATLNADDHIVGIYLNGKRMATTPTTPFDLGGGATPNEQWRMGANELAFAVRDDGGGAMWLYVENVTQPVCNWRPAPPPPQAVPAMNAWSLAALGGLLGGAAAWRRRKKRA